MSVFVVGSFVMDIVTTTNLVPNKGETVLGLSYDLYPGGKGINQAVSANRLGSKVIMAGALGQDDYGKTFKNLMKNEGIDSQYVKLKQSRTGLGNIVLNKETADNQIIVIPGANHDYNLEDLKSLEDEIKNANVIVAQLELPINVVESLALLCGRYKKKFILNPAPAAKLKDETYPFITYLTPNETELAWLTNIPIQSNEDIKDAAKKLLNKGVENVIVTLGDKGSMWVHKDFVKVHPGYHQKAVDTVGAGDTFNGALAYGIDHDLNADEILKIANAAGSLCVTKHGAIPSIPNMKEVQEFLRKLKPNT